MEPDKYFLLRYALFLAVVLYVLVWAVFAIGGK